jgi:hypothetical protein
MGWALDMERRFYERGSLRRGASCVLCAVLVALPAGCGPAEEPPAKAVAPDSRQIDAAMRAIEAYMAADKPSEAVFVAEKLAADAPGLMRAHLTAVEAAAAISGAAVEGAELLPTGLSSPLTCAHGSDAAADRQPDGCSPSAVIRCTGGASRTGCAGGAR